MGTGSTSAAAAPSKVSTSSGALPGAGLAKFLQLRGRRIVEANGVLWHSVRNGLYMSLPYQLEVSLEPRQVNEMLKSMGALGVRFPSRTRPGLPSGLYVYRHRNFDVHALQRQFRAKVRRGLDTCEVRRVAEQELLSQGLQLNLQTMRRQGRYDAEFGDPEHWRRFVDAVRQCPEVVPMGSFMGDQLLAYAITCREDGWLHVLHQMSRSDALEQCPNHALTFVLTRQITTDLALQAVCLGYKSIVDNVGLHEYKRRFGYEMIEQHSVIQLRPGASALLSNSLAISAIQVLRRLRPSDQRLELAASVMSGARLSKGVQAGVGPDRPTVQGDAEREGNSDRPGGRLLAWLRQT